MEPDAEERIKAAAQAQVIECLNRFYAMETGLWGGPLDALIVRTIIVGDIQEDYLKERLWPLLPPEKKKCDVCILPSHGIHATQEEAEATRPAVAVGSVWLPWARSIPAWRVYTAVGATVYVTGVHGDIEIVSDGERFTVTTQRDYSPAASSEPKP